jgi:glucans biosynthesis protein
MTLRVERLQPTQPVELRAYLKSGSHALTETWTSVIQPE